MTEKQDDDVTFVPEDIARRDDNSPLEQQVEQLQEDIKTDLEEIKNLTGGNSTWFVRGIMQGAGAIIGSILMLIFLGWILGIIGIIPGFGEIADFIGVYLDRVSRY